MENFEDFCLKMDNQSCLNPTALRKAKIAYSCGLSEFNRVNEYMNICEYKRSKTFFGLCLKTFKV